MRVPAGAFLALVPLLGAACSNSTPTTPLYTISGAVSGAVADGVLITLGGAATQQTTTANMNGVDGDYLLTGLMNGSYTLTPSLAGYTFNPTALSLTISGASVSSENFIASQGVSPTDGGLVWDVGSWDVNTWN